MALSKGLSAGVVPFAATLASEKVYQGFYSDDRSHTLFHGHSMTANPAGCAAANASLDLIDDTCMAQIKWIESWNQENLRTLCAGRASSLIRTTRQMGSIAAMEIALNSGYTGSFSPNFRERCVEKGLLVRPLGNIVYLCLPYITERSELDRIYEILEETIVEFGG